MRVRAPKFYYQEMELLETISDYITVFHAPFLIFCEKRILDQIGSQLKTNLDAAKIQWEIVPFEKNCTKELARNEAEKYDEFKTVIGIGEKGILDFAKAVGAYADLPTIVVPTTASSNTVCSSEIIFYKNQQFDQCLKLGKCPDMVLADPEMIVSSSPHSLACGMASVIATYLENKVLSQAEISGRVKKGTISFTVASASKESYDRVLQYGQKAFKDMEQHICTDEIEQVIEAIFYLSGIGLENGASAAIHPIAEGITSFQGVNLVYEEAISIGILVQMIMNGDCEEDFQKIKQLLKSWKLPVCLSDIGINDIRKTAEELAKWICSLSSSPLVLPFSMRYEFIAGAFLLLEEQND